MQRQLSNWLILCTVSSAASIWMSGANTAVNSESRPSLDLLCMPAPGMAGSHRSFPCRRSAWHRPICRSSRSCTSCVITFCAAPVLREAGLLRLGSQRHSVEMGHFMDGCAPDVVVFSTLATRAEQFLHHPSFRPRDRFADSSSTTSHQSWATCLSYRSPHLRYVSGRRPRLGTAPTRSGTAARRRTSLKTLFLPLCLAHPRPPTDRATPSTARVLAAAAHTHTHPGCSLESQPHPRLASAFDVSALGVWGSTSLRLVGGERARRTGMRYRR